MLPGAPEIAGGGLEGLRVQPQLDRPDIDARVKQGRRTTMAQGMDAVAVRDPRGPLRVIGDLLGGADRQRRLGIEARKHPRRAGR
jgi:hypothetical protein